MRVIQSVFTIHVVIFLLLFWLGHSNAQTWSGAGGDNNWSTAGNWVGGVAPTSSATASITFDNPSARNSPFQNLASPFALEFLNIRSDTGAFTLNGQPLRFAGASSSNVHWQGANTITVNQDWEFASNTSSIGTSTSNALIHNGNISGSGNYTLSNSVAGSNGGLTSNGAWTGSGFVTVGGNNATLTINGSMANTYSALQVGSNGNFATNAGNLRGTGTINANIRTADSSLQNNTVGSSGTLTVNGGIQLFSNSRLRVTEGTIAANGLVDIQTDGLLIVNSGATLGGMGNIQIEGWGDLSVAGTVASNKTISLNQTNSYSSGNFASLSGEGIINSTINLTGGRIAGGLTMNGAVNVNPLNATNAPVWFGTPTGSDSTLSNLTVNGQVRFLGSDAFVGGNIGGTGSFLVDAGRSVVVGNGPTSIAINSITVRGALSSGFTTYSGGTTINLESAQFFTSSNDAVHGTLVSTGVSNINIFSGTQSTFNGSILVNSGTLTTTGILEGTGTLSVASGATHRLGNSASRVRIDVGGSGSFIGTAGARYERNLNLTGATVSGPINVDGNLNINTNAVSSLNTGSTLTVSGQTNVNQGTLRVNSGATLTGAGGLAVNGSAILDVQGTVSKNVVVEQLGKLQGIGQLNTNAIIRGTLAPGNSAGTIGINGTVDLTIDSTVDIEIGGVDFSMFDSIVGLGDASRLTLGGGNLNITLINGFVPTQTDQFLIARNFAFRTGEFGNDGGDTNRVLFSQGSFDIDYQPTAIRLVNFQAVPEPSAVMLVGLAGLMGGVWGRWRRRKP
jgi:hypothetical protein